MCILEFPKSKSNEGDTEHPRTKHLGEKFNALLDKSCTWNKTYVADMSIVRWSVWCWSGRLRGNFRLPAVKWRRITPRPIPTRWSITAMRKRIRWLRSQMSHIWPRQNWTRGTTLLHRSGGSLDVMVMWRSRNCCTPHHKSLVTHMH